MGIWGYPIFRQCHFLVLGFLMRKFAAVSSWCLIGCDFAHLISLPIKKNLPKSPEKWDRSWWDLLDNALLDIHVDLRKVTSASTPWHHAPAMAPWPSHGAAAQGQFSQHTYFSMNLSSEVLKSCAAMAAMVAMALMLWREDYNYKIQYMNEYECIL